MIQSLQSLKSREALPRIIADFLIVHLSMISALAVSVIYQTARGHGPDAQQITSQFSQYYVSFFWLLSPIFPIVFLLNGFYTHSRAYVGKYKILVIFRGVAVAVMLFFAANFLLFGSAQVGRSVAVPFAAWAALGLCSARLLKAWFQRHYDVKPRNRADVRSRLSRVLVVGGAGYIGSLLAERLLEKGYKVRVLDSLVYGDEPLRPVRDNPDFELIVGDCRNIQDVVRAVHGVDSIIHLAAIVGDPACEQDRASALETNYAATRMLIEIAKGNGVNRLLFASSCSVYGTSEHEVNEESPVFPMSLYAQTKVDSEKALLEAASETFHPTILRFATVFGLSYRPRFDLVVNLLTAKASRESIITIFNGHQWRPFIHVKDVAEAIVHVLESSVRFVGGQVFNVGDSRLNHTLSEVAGLIRDAFPTTRVEHVDNGDRRNYRVSFKKLEQRVAFRARYSVQDGIQELKNAFEERLIADYTDLRYHNQRFLKEAGGPGHKNEMDVKVMAAFAGVSVNGRAAEPHGQNGNYKQVVRGS
ncbi:MAG: NAD-dependent dehydratase [Acidobacteria bacterium]|nr:MAG: NAD-dependent dehydratase [Acidobacteriota bacterium]